MVGTSNIDLDILYNHTERNSDPAIVANCIGIYIWVNLLAKLITLHIHLCTLLSHFHCVEYRRKKIMQWQIILINVVSLSVSSAET